MNQFRQSANPVRFLHRRGRVSMLYGALASVVLLLSHAVPARAQPGPPVSPCPPVVDLTDQHLKNIPPEIVSDGTRLRGTVVLTDNQRNIETVTTGAQTGTCSPQIQRFFQEAEGRDVAAPGQRSGLPIPGPTLRANLGDIVELTFLNQINPLDYGSTIDVAENLVTGPVVPGTGCDAATNGSGYPTLANPVHKGPLTDELPNCFHGSSTGNLHFHGTHTSPDGTADNVFLGVRPSPRIAVTGPGVPPGTTAPVVTGASVRADFDEFFGVCEQKLKADMLLQWPATWAEMAASGPGAANWLNDQITMLTAYDAGKPPHQPLLPIDQSQEVAGEFPQYYIGSFPYCFQLPRYTATSFPPPAGPPGQPVLQMGQSPGTMWYHAHKHGSTSMDVSNGMTGAFIIEDNSPGGYDGAIKAYYLKHPNDRKKSGQIRPDDTWPILQSVMVVNQIAGIPQLVTLTGGGPNPFSINGQQVPNLTMRPGEVQLWRIINASPISAFYLPGLPAGFAWQQTAQDGVQFSETNFNDRKQHPIYVAPGNRIDLLVQAPTTPGPSYPIYVVQGRSKSATEGNTALPPPTVLNPTAPTKYKPFLNVVVAGTQINGMDINFTMPARPPFLNDIADSELAPAPAGRHTLNFNTYLAATGSSQHSISVDGGKQFKFSYGPSLKIPQLGLVEEWKITNDSNARVDHPFHIHINPFQVLAVFDPNAPLTNANGQIQFDSSNNPIPLYIFKTTGDPPGGYPILQPNGQCKLNQDDATTWHPCQAQAPVVAGSTKNIWWDVFPIPDGKTNPSTVANVPKIIPGYFTLRTRFEDYKGSYVIHCHILAHEDRGMMLEVDLATNDKVPMQHH